LEAELELVAELLRPRELLTQDRPRAVRPRLALDRDVTGEAGEVRLPGHERQAVEVRDRGEVRIARKLADLSGREPREAGPFAHQPVEVRGGHEPRARAPVQVDELREEELDPALRGDLPDLLELRIARDDHQRSILREVNALFAEPAQIERVAGLAELATDTPEIVLDLDAVRANIVRF